MTAAVQLHDLVVGHILDHLGQFRIFTEEVLTGVGAAISLVVLQLAVADFVHALAQQALFVFFEQRVPVATPKHLDHVPAGTFEDTFQFLHDLAVTTHRAIQTLQVTVDHEDQVFKLLAPRQGDGTQGFRLVTLAVAQERPHLAVATLDQVTRGQVTHYMRLVDRLDRAQPHGDGRELPEVRHQPGMRVGRQAIAIHFTPEIVQLLFGQTPSR